MADFKVNKLSEEERKAQMEKKSARKVWILLIVICLVLGIISLVLFLWKQFPLSIDEKIDNGVFGTFGDFIGGILGTIVAVFSVYFLVRTLRGQIDSNAETEKSNKSVIDSNKRLLELNNLQLFDNQFQTLYKQYLNAVDSYIDGDLTGRKAFEKKVKVFLSQEFDNAFEYKRRSKAAIALFEDFYAENRTECSVHFRVLYLLSSLIAEAGIDDTNRVVYAKCIRGQLSEGELAILRYNCNTSNGRKMQQYANHFNLLKHLPLMTLFEFRQWKKAVVKEEYLSALDSFFITLKKSITNLNENPEKLDDSIEISSRYKFDYSFDRDHKNFVFTINKKKKHEKGGGIKRPLCEKAFDCLEDSQLVGLLEAYLYDAFVASSFGLYNNDDDCKLCPDRVIKNTAEDLIASITVQKTKRIVLSEMQVVPGT